ncbi:hypothetical protein H5410_054200, partial [Solanum commersonii]
YLPVLQFISFESSAYRNNLSTTLPSKGRGIEQSRAYSQGAVGAILVYDITKCQSFDHMARWLEELRGHADKNIVIMLIANKCDLGSLQAVPVEDAQEFAERENLFFMETSALQSTNVDGAFMTVLIEIYKIISKNMLIAAPGADYGKSQSLKGTRIIVPGQDSDSGGNSGGCCMSSCFFIEFWRSFYLSEIII